MANTIRHSADFLPTIAAIAHSEPDSQLLSAMSVRYREAQMLFSSTGGQKCLFKYCTSPTFTRVRNLNWQKRPPGWGAIRRPVGVFSLCNDGGAERSPLRLREQFLQGRSAKVKNPGNAKCPKLKLYFACSEICLAADLPFLHPPRYDHRPPRSHADFFVLVDNFSAPRANIISRTSFASRLPRLAWSMSMRFASSGVNCVANGFS